MNPSDEGAGTSGVEQTEAQQATEQTKPVTKSFQEQLTEAAKQIGIEVGDTPEKPVEAISSEPDEGEDVIGLEIEGEPLTGDNDAVGHEDEPDAEESGNAPPEGVDASVEAVEAQEKADKKVPLSEVLKEREAKKRYKSEAEIAAQKAAQLESELALARAPKPTVKDPFADVMSIAQLKKVEAEYRALLIDADRVPEDAEEVPIGDGKVISKADFDAIVKDADRNLKWFLPERQAYLEARERAEAEATVPYPELKEDNAFTKEVDKVMQLVLSGEAQKRPDLRLMCARLVRGYQYEMAVAAEKNGKNGAETAEKIVKSAKQKIAPTPVKSRSIPERSASANLDKAKKAFEKSGSAEDALAYYTAQQAAKATSRSLAPIRG